jgi:hypothetical protein
MAFMQIEVNGDMSGLTLAMSKGRSLNGRVIFNGKSAPPPKQLRLLVQTGPGWEMSPAIVSRPPHAPVDDDLRFTLSGIFRIPLAVGIQGLPDGWALEAVRYNGRDITDILTDFGADGSGSLEIVLTDRVATLPVRVVDEQTGQPVSAYRLVVIPSDPARWKAASWSAPLLRQDTGTVTVRPLVPGNYLIAALSPSDILAFLDGQHVRVNRLAETATPITVTEGNNPIVELRLVTLPAEIR